VVIGELLINELAVELDFSNKEMKNTLIYMGTAVAQQLRCCATNWKAAGSIPTGVIGIFH